MALPGPLTLAAPLLLEAAPSTWNAASLEWSRRLKGPNWPRQPRPTAPWLSDVMDRLLEATRRAEDLHFWFRGFRRFVHPLLARATTGLTDARLLDCGCGTGANLTLLARFGCAYGVDLAWTSVRYARGAGHTRVVRASVTRLPFPDASVDVATSFDVIYSLEDQDERTAVREMFRVLRPGGRAIVNVAALELLRGDHSVLSREVRRYTAPRLRTLVEEAGFLVERLTYTNATLLPVMLPVRLLQRMRGLAPEARADSDIRVPPPIVNGCLSALLALEARLLRVMNMPAGSSLLCLARKPARTESP